MAHRVVKKAQVTLELVFAVVCLFLILAGTLQVFLWLGSRFAVRQRLYEETRVAAASVPRNRGGEVQVDDSSLPKLNIFAGSQENAVSSGEIEVEGDVQEKRGGLPSFLQFLLERRQ